MSTTKHSTIDADGVSVFYREAGPPTAPVILLLHGFPASSHSYRNLIPLLSQTYRVIAPDFPGYGFTTVPASRSYTYTFDALATTTLAFLDALSITRFSVYIFDYGAPVGLRLALKRPEAISAIISQNGNAYVEGFGAEFWAPFQKYWKSQSSTDREAIRSYALTFAATKMQYEAGVPASHLPNLAPEAYHLDYALLNTPENNEIQLDLFNDYRKNLDVYPAFQKYFRESQVPLLAIWGKNDFIFVWPGAEAFKRDLPKAEIVPLDSAHFTVETHTEELASNILGFLKRNGV